MQQKLQNFAPNIHHKDHNLH